MNERKRERDTHTHSHTHTHPAMSTSKRCMKEDGRSTYNWQCSRRSHPVQPMGGVCAMCLTERLSNIARCADAAPPPRLTDQASFGYLRFAAPSHESMDPEGIAPNHNMLTQFHISVQQCDNHMGVQEMSARHSSAGSEQSIASLIEREIDEGRRRYSDVTAGFSTLPAGLKELALESSNERRAAACAKQVQLARSRSYSTNSHFNSIHSTPASCKSNSSLLSGGDSCKPCCGGRTDSTTSRRCSTAAVEGSNYHALLTKSKSTGSNYNASKLRSPIHVWNLPNFLHRKCNHMETRYDSSSDDHSVLVQADDSAPFMKLPRSCSKNTGAANCINRDMMCLGKWLNRSTPSSFHPTRRRTTSCKGSSSTTSIMQARHNSSACAQESLAITQEVAASSSSTVATSHCSADLQVVDARIAKGISVCGRWHLPSFNMSQKSTRRRASTIHSTPDLGLGVISATNQNSAYKLSEMPDTCDDQYSSSRDHKAGATGRGVAALVSAHSKNAEKVAYNECINEQGKTDGAAGVISAINREIPHCDTAESSSTSTYMSRNRGSGHLLNISTQFSFRSRVEYTPTLYSGHGMKMHPSIMNQCQSIAALVSMDANLIHLI